MRTLSSAGEFPEQLDPDPLLTGMPTAQPLWQIVWQFLTKLRIHLLEDKAIPLLGIYPKKIKTYARKNTYMDV